MDACTYAHTCESTHRYIYIYLKKLVDWALKSNNQSINLKNYIYIYILMYVCMRVWARVCVLFGGDCL